MAQAHYQSTLTKQGLAYNIIYHLSKLEPGESAYALIEKLLSNFELKSIENS